MIAARVVAVVGVVAGAGVVTTAATAPKEVSAAAPVVYPFPCKGEDSLLVTKQGDDPKVNGVHKLKLPISGGTVEPTEPVITMDNLIGVTTIKNLKVNNQVGVSASNNQRIIFTTTDNDTGMSIVDYDIANQRPYVVPVPGPTDGSPRPGGVAGVINLDTGQYVFGSVGSPDQRAGYAMLNIYDPTNPTNIRYNALQVRLGDGTAHGTNGDIAFDSNGSLYIVTSTIEKYWVYIVEHPEQVPDPANPTERVATLASTGPTNVMNGFAFGNDGYLYASIRSGPNGTGVLARFDPSTGKLLTTFDLAIPSDLASCADPNRIRLYKNLPGGRYNPTDQFFVEITGAGQSAAQNGTTTGTDGGLQDQPGEYAGPAIGVAGGEFTITEKPVGTTDFANYVTTWKCIDESNNNKLVAEGTGVTGSVTLPTTGGVDVNCAFTNIPKAEIKLQKDLPVGRIATGDQFRLSITPGGAPDATTTGTSVGVQAETATLVDAIPGTQYTVSEAAAGTTSLSNYTSSWACVDNGNAGIPLANGTGVSGAFTLPTPGGPNRQKILCTLTNVPIVSTIIPSKSVSPPDGSTVYVGDTLTYTLTFDNPGTTPAPVNYVDDFAGVVDDAEMTSAPTVSSGTGLSLTAPAGGKFTITGSVPAASSATVTYKVKVKADDKRGDNDLLNFLLPPGTPTPTTCPAGNNLCTENPVPEPVVSKTVDPVDGSTVLAGQTLTYTLTFDNTLGKAPAPVNWTDNLADVVDDAVVTAPPSSSNPALTASAVTGNQFTVTGSIPTGATATVTYKVQVKPEGQRGNNDLLNYVFPTGTTPPTTCAVGNPLCTENPVPQPIVSKSADPADGTAVKAGQTVTYTLTFDNSAGKAPATIAWDDDVSGVLDDATLSKPPFSSDPGLAATAPSPRGVIKITGTLGAGKTATVTYKVVVKADDQRGDNLLLNFVFTPGTEPPTTCVEGNPLCTVHPVPELVVSKSVDPADGSTVQPGQILTYTQTFDNTLGKAPAPLDWTDNLAGVIDDATVTSAPVSSDPAVIASAVAAGKFTVTGNVPAGKKATVTYKVQVKPDGQRGDGVLLNYLFPTGTTPPTSCPVGNPLCTENPVPELTVTKSADPADGTVVVAGQMVTYTLTFDNTKGKASSPVDWDDDISGVLDDAVVSAPPVSSDSGVTATGPSLRGIIKVTGTVAAGKKVTVTYKAQVKPDGQRGDNDLLNFLFPTGTTPPSTCVAGNPLCTEHLVPEPVVTKSVDPVDGSTVNASQVLTYTMTFSNAKGKAPAEIAWDDNLSRVLDDANVTAAPTASNAALTVSAITNGVFNVRGTLAPGQTVLVTMKVQVKPDGQRGDNDLLNFLLKPGQTLPSTCLVGDPLCTENPVPATPAINVDKTVVLVTDTAGNGLSTPGDVVTYGFKVTNIGNVTLTNIVLTDPKLSITPLNCPKTTLTPGESMDCTGPTYTLTAADLAAGKTVNVATVTGKPPVGPNVNDSDDAEVPVYPPSVLPTTGGSFPKQAERLAPVLIIVGALLLLVASRRRYGRSVSFK